MVDSESERLLIGAMSGTSCDGVDAALVAVRGRGEGMTALYVAHVERPFPADFRRELLRIREAGGCSFAELAAVGRTLTLAYAAAVNDLLAETGATGVLAVAAHGQTLYHAPPDTIQWLDPSLLAAETGLAVVSDFRRADCAAGGQGAPLVPFADWIFFRHAERSRVILNLGGIANLTYLPAGGGIDDVVAFDTGPGCCLSDWLMRTHDPSGPAFDADGMRAMEGKANGRWSEWVLAQPYFNAPPPKSTDVPTMLALCDSAPAAVRPWAGRRRADDDLALVDELAEASRLVALAVERAVATLPRRPDQVVVAGGGMKNRAIMRAIGRNVLEHLPPNWVRLDGGCNPRPTDEFGLPAQAREAACFAVLGAATLDGEPGNVPRATGARRRVVLGSVTPRPA